MLNLAYNLFIIFYKLALFLELFYKFMDFLEYFYRFSFNLEKFSNSILINIT
jgi:hypothetical protein